MPKKNTVTKKKVEIIDDISDVDSPPKKKLVKNATKSRGRKKPADDSEDDFKVDNDSYPDDNEDFEEEKSLKKKLNSKKDEYSDVEYKDDEDEEEIKPKLKRGKKNEPKKNTSKKADGKSEPKKTVTKKEKKETTKSPKNGAKKETKKQNSQSDNEENPGTESTEKMLMNPEEAVFNFNEDGEIDESKYYIPPWIQEGNVRDANGRKPDDRNYDPTTVYIPPEELSKQSPLLQQYWSFKSKHFDKIIAMKMWKFYYFFYYDAFIAQKITDMKINKWGRWTFLFFHETTMAKVSHKFLAQGHKIVVIEQMEENKSKDELVKREICQVLTRGTAIENQDLDYSSRYMLAIFEDNLRFGVVLCDTTTHEFLLGEFADDENRGNLRTLLMRTKPVEVVYMKSFIEQDTINMVKSLSSKPALSTVLSNEPKQVENIFGTLRDYFVRKPLEGEQAAEPELPPLLTQIKGSFESEMNNVNMSQYSQSATQERKLPFYSTMQALSICVEFLQNVLLAEAVVSMGTFTPFDLAVEKKSSLYLDSQALQNLEVLDVQYLNVLSESHSLFGYMDKTVTAFGKRMFKRWLTSPSMNAEAIKERQDAVDDLIKNMDVVDYFREKLGKLPDIERMTNRIYNLSNKQRMSASYFEDFAKNRLKDFLAFLKELKKIEDLVETFKDYVPNFSSKRLIELTTLKDVDINAFKERKKGSTGKKQKGKPTGIFPRINHIISDLEGMIEMRDGQPIPAPGVSAENDELVEKISEIKSILQDYLEKQRKKFHNNDIKYTHTKHRYELEIPEHLVEGSKRPKEYAITSKRKGFLRFHTPDIENCLRKLHHYEYDFQKVFTPFICDYFKKFYERNHYWQQVISCLGELDCLCSLAQLACTMNIKCRPEVLPVSDRPIFELHSMVHPMAAKTNPNFVPNDVIVEDPVDTFLITGPNMGGKSTLLRQTCLAVIMAQVGSYVPAKKFKLSAIDRIFTRVGASDRILEGKSTFFIEMEETYNIVKEATKNSLLIVDELGRGTSTYDGVSIAYGTLKYIVEHIGCITLFATHYHLLLEEFKLYKNIDTYFMDCEFNEEDDEIKFLYKFVKGQALKSHGVVIAKMAGLPDNVIELAKEKAAFMTKEKRNIGFERNILEKFHQTIAEMTKLESNANYDPNKILHELNQIH